MSEQIKNFINGQWKPGSGASFESCDPANGELIGTANQSTPADVKEAIDSASAAFPAWKAIPQPKRAEIVYKVGDIFKRRKEEIAQLMSREMGKPIAEARGDTQEGVDMAYYIASEGRRAWGWTVPSELPNKRMYVERVPLGVCTLITPWNFPIAIPTWKTFPALVMGNTVVLKPAEDTPLLANKFAEILIEAGVPKGVFNVVHGSGGPISDALVTDPRVRMISFTGSSAVGAAIAGKAAPLHKRYSLEMGGKNPVVVMPDADMDLAIDAVLWCAFGTTGQRCTACSRLILVDPVGDSFVNKLKERATKLKLGHGADPTTQVAALINKKALDKVADYVRIGRDEDKAKLILGGERATDGALSKGNFFKPTLFDHVKQGMRIEQEEIFGPVLSIIRAKSYDEAIKVANGVKYGLSSSIFTRDVNVVNRFQTDIEAGLVYINAGTTGAEVSTPFGGHKATGNGHREGGPTVIEAYSELKSVFIDYSGQVQKAQIDNN
ncbi:MAG: aldehyde dehydrogenase family protein [Planctomycetaceae bacterium]|nr:aldehyde dehydrogenase family protein [Planctomycetaceae bacterium]